ncbi:hypothetical protein SASPL_144297 [Salvia splendens]|uniref:Casein kinase substrate phosphoprotein PP28 domain-containing protein n=1 Tax=Salvia splendens TaxID=180675 RepID=A0A8X8WFG1_SALSN|nr:hypothetical protein SASPL_144297 [Salvia splendens]
MAKPVDSQQHLYSIDEISCGSNTFGFISFRFLAVIDLYTEMLCFDNWNVLQGVTRDEDQSKVAGDYADRLNKKSRIKAAHHSKRAAQRKLKRKHQRENTFDDCDDDPAKAFFAAFGRDGSSWNFRCREQRSEWTEYSNQSNSRFSEHAAKSVTYADRKILGLPETGPLKIEDVKTAFRSSALKWHPDRHQPRRLQRERYGNMGRGKFKGKPTGRRQFSTPEEMIAGSSARPRTFRKEVADIVEDETSDVESEEESDSEPEKVKGAEGVIQIENPNMVKPKNMKARDADLEKTTELSRREREEIEKQKAHERYMKLQEQGKTDQAKKDLERLALIRQQRADAAKKREEEKAGNSLFRFSCAFVIVLPVATNGLFVQPKNKRRLKDANNFAAAFVIRK